MLRKIVRIIPNNRPTVSQKLLVTRRTRMSAGSTFGSFTRSCHAAGLIRMDDTTRLGKTGTVLLKIPTTPVTQNHIANKWIAVILAPTLERCTWHGCSHTCVNHIAKLCFDDWRSGNAKVLFGASGLNQENRNDNKACDSEHLEVEAAAHHSANRTVQTG